MVIPLQESRRPVYDIVGIGLGPSNLALAIAVREHNESMPPDCRLSAVFLEKRKHFGWHSGLLIDGATMQVSFLKDLVTLRNPESRFGFVSYLHHKNRLNAFINHKTLFPLRTEFHDYLAWVAAQFADVTRYGMEVVDVRPTPGNQDVEHLDVLAVPDARPADRVVVRTRNVVVGIGLSPVLPSGIRLSDRIWHSSQLVDRLATETGRSARRFAVVGAGQSAAEVTSHLHGTVPDSQVYAIFARYGYSPADDSPFANRVFDPDAVDEFFESPPTTKKLFYDYHANTNYSVVEGELISELYRRVYQESVRGARRLHVLGMSEVAGVDPTAGGGLAVRVRSLVDGQTGPIPVDVIVYATGYAPMDPLTVLAGMAGLIRRDKSGRVRTGRDYRVQTRHGVRCGIYLQGGTEHSHGLSSSLLSNTAVRAGEIVASLLDQENLARLAQPAAAGRKD